MGGRNERKQRDRQARKRGEGSAWPMAREDLLPAEVGENVCRMGSFGETSSSVGDMLNVKCPLGIC